MIGARRESRYSSWVQNGAPWPDVAHDRVDHFVEHRRANFAIRGVARYVDEQDAHLMLAPSLYAVFVVSDDACIR